MQAITERIRTSRFWNQLQIKNTNVMNEEKIQMMKMTMTVTKNKKCAMGRDPNDIIVSCVHRSKKDAKVECIRRLLVKLYQDLGGT